MTDQARPKTMAHSLTDLLTALNLSKLALAHDPYGLPMLRGTNGHIQTWDDHGGGWVIYAAMRSSRGWNLTKQELRPFCELTQDGDDEGCFRLRHLPTPHQAAIIRRRLGLRKRRAVSDTELARLRAQGFHTGSALNNGTGDFPSEPVSDTGFAEVALTAPQKG